MRQERTSSGHRFAPRTSPSDGPYRRDFGRSSGIRGWLLYTAFFLILSAWGLEANEPAFVFIAGTLGVVGVSLAIALTVSSERRWLPAATTAALGLAVLLVVFALDGDAAAAIAVSALVMVAVAAVLLRTGAMDPLTS